MARQPCLDCKRRPPVGRRRRCATCQLRREPIGDQVAAARRRLAMVPPELRVKRTKAIVAMSPPGTTWCAGCQSFRDLEDFGKGATQCRACTSARAHAAAIEKTYGLTGDGYEKLLALQGGGCAVCGARPKSKRLAVDHDHKTGAVRGLLCSRHNHDALGALADSLAMVGSLWHYLNTPPASGAWSPITAQAQLAPVATAERPSPASAADLGIVARRDEKSPRAAKPAAPAGECTRPHYLPIGSKSVPGKRGVWWVWIAEDGDDDDPPY